MTLVKTLRETLIALEAAEADKEMGFSGSKPPLHQVITGNDGEARLAQAKEYARELIQRGTLKNTPVEMNCHQPMSDAMVQQFFKDAKKGMLIADGIEHLARQETFTSLAMQAVNDGSCIVVMCGTNESLQRLFADDPGLPRRFMSKVDMDDPDILSDIKELEARQQAAEIEKMLTVQNPVQPMRPLRFVPKPDK
ncbi:MAG: hypothetical protein ACAH83_04085 [Alphaproteobacteria bacterium]